MNIKQIPGLYPYYATDDGRIFRELKQSIDKDGYKRIVVQSGKSFAVHRLVVQTFLSDWDPNLEVNHKDFARDNNNLDNLEMCTREYNNQYSRDHNRSGCFGPKKLTQEQVDEIRSLRGIKSQRQLAQLFNLSRSTISDIQTYKLWKDKTSENT